MVRDLLNTIILASSFLVLFGIAELLYHKFHVRAEITRKIVHIVTGLLTLLFPILLKNHWLVLFLCASFAIILILSLRFNFLKSINAIDRESVGAISYPFAVFGCYLAYEYSGYRGVYHYNDQAYTFFYLPILILALCDPIAALIGKRWPIGKIRNKTLMGSFAFFIVAFALSFIFTHSILLSIAIAIISTLAEAISPRGYDNITIPSSVLLVLFLYK